MPPKPKSEPKSDEIASGSLDDLKLHDTPSTPADAGQVAAADDPREVEDADASEEAKNADQTADESGATNDHERAGHASNDDEPCAEHFPGGWDSENIRRAEEVTGSAPNHVTCEHGTYKRGK